MRAVGLALLACLAPSLLLAAADPEFGIGKSWVPTVTQWSRGKAAAVSLTFDDNCPGQLKFAVPAMNQRGIRGSFFIITDLAGSRGEWSEYRRLAAQGHEIGSHTLSHPDFQVKDRAARERELMQSRAVIDSMIPEARCFSLALPYGWRDDNLMKIAKRSYGGVRITNQWEGLADIKDLHEVRGMIPYGNTPVSEMNAWVTLASAKGRWLVEIYHGIQDDGWEKIPAERFTAHLDHLADKQARLWIAPFGEVARYTRERREASLRLEAYEDSLLRYSLADSLPDSIYGTPLTVKARLPAGWTGFRAEQNGVAVWREFRWENAMPFALFEAIPDRGPITVTRGGGPDRRPEVAVLPKPGIYGSPQVVTLDAGPQADIRYTLDGRSPSMEGIPYTGPITLASSACVRYEARKKDDVLGSSGESHFIIAAGAPKVAAIPPEGAYAKPLLVTFEADQGTEMRYTLDGSDPVAASPAYRGPIRLDTTATLKILAMKPGVPEIPILVQDYVIAEARLGPRASPRGGRYREIQRIAFSIPEGSTLFYTVDGTLPTVNSTRYADPVWIDHDTVLRFVSMDRFGALSPAQEEKYFIRMDQSMDVQWLPLSELGERQGVVSFSVVREESLRLSFRDSQGREMVVLFDDRAEPLHVYTFSVPPDPWAPGTYFWVLERRGFPLLKKRVALHR